MFSFTATAWGNPVPTVDDLSLREQVGQTIMPRVLIGEQKAFKQAVLNGEVTGFFIKAKEGALRNQKLPLKIRRVLLPANGNGWKKLSRT